MKQTCSHCHLEYDEDALYTCEIGGVERRFCCKGCEGVFRLLGEYQLDSFYDRLGTSTLKPPKELKDDLSKFDSLLFLEQYLNKIDENTAEIALIIEGIHCIACVWLNQKILDNAKGILATDINYTNNKAKITFNPQEIKVSEIIRLIRSIGYDAKAYDPKTLEAINARERRDYYTRMIVGVFATMNIMWIAVAQYLGYFLGMDRDIKDILNFASFVLATPTLFYSGWIFFRGGYYGLKNGFINMDLLVSIGASLTYFYSIYAALTHVGETYFESVTMIITFILIGKFLEVRSRKSAGDRIDKLISEIPTQINILKNGKILEISPQEAEIGDVVALKPGEKIILDGILLSKNALLDSSMLTGESVYVEKTAGEAIISGSINMDYHINYRVTKKFSESTMSHIITLIQESINKKPNIQNKANSISHYFSGFVFVVAALTFAVWWYVSGVESAIVVAVSVIIIACPCALALATPIATIAGISEAYKHKLLFKEARFLETFAKTNAIIFDKTGTLTYGKPKVVNVRWFGESGGGLDSRERVDLAESCAIVKSGDFAESAESRALLYSLLYSFVNLNNHPISNGIKQYLENLDSAESSVESVESATEFKAESKTESKAESALDSKDSSIESAESKTDSTTNRPQIAQKLPLEDFKQISQKGIQANYKGQILLGGSYKFMREMGVKCKETSDNNMSFYFAINGEIRAIFSLEDSLKENAKEVVRAFLSYGFRVVCLSGDRHEVVAKIAESVGISEYYFEQTPQDKSEFIDKLHEKGFVCVMVGDGINDAIALNKSDIAISMGQGSDVAIESSDIVLLDDSLESLLKAYRLSKTTYDVIKQNIKISIIYNLLTIPLAAFGFIIPLFAALSMSFSSLLVTLNSLKIKVKNG